MRTLKDVILKVKTILVSQPEPTSGVSPYHELARKQKVQVDFRPFIHIEGKTSREIRQQKIDLSKFSAIILTSRNSVDHFFRIAEEMRYPIPNALKYFCLSEAVAFYLQKYVVYRKRKIYVGGRTFDELTEVIKKHPDESYILPGPNVLSPTLIDSIFGQNSNAEHNVSPPSLPHRGDDNSNSCKDGEFLTTSAMAIAPPLPLILL